MALVGARSASRRILDEELLDAADEVHWATDDGSAGFHGTVVDLMRHWREHSLRAPSVRARDRPDSADALRLEADARVGRAVPWPA